MDLGSSGTLGSDLGGMFKELGSMAIPIIAIIMGISSAMWGAWLNYRRRSDLLQAHHAERMAAIEKGIELPPLPPELLNPASNKDRSGEYSRFRHQRIGLILLLTGVAVSAALWGTHQDSYLWGLVPAAVGIAYLLSSYLEARQLPPPGRSSQDSSNGPHG